MPTAPYVSIIIPAYNEASRLPGTLDKILAHLQRAPYTAEIVVVENGSTDATAQVVLDFGLQKEMPGSVNGIKPGKPSLALIKAEGKGKGLAVREGMLAASGVYRFMCDADLSMPISELDKFFPPLENGHDIVIASREAPGSVRYDEPHYRHIGGRLVNWMIHLMILPRLADTQCGFKCFRSEVAPDLFQHQTLTGWSFDVEVLYIARLRGYKLLELAIPWYFSSESKVNPMQDTYKMFHDIRRIRQNAKNGVYNLPISGLPQK